MFVQKIRTFNVDEIDYCSQRWMKLRLLIGTDANFSYSILD